LTRDTQPQPHGDSNKIQKKREEEKGEKDRHACNILFLSLLGLFMRDNHRKRKTNNIRRRKKGHRGEKIGVKVPNKFLFCFLVMLYERKQTQPLMMMEMMKMMMLLLLFCCFVVVVVSLEHGLAAKTLGRVLSGKSIQVSGVGEGVGNRRDVVELLDP